MMLYSVILPAHRADPLLLDAIRSVESAISNDDAELIVVVNGVERATIVEMLKNSGLSSRTRVLTSEIPSLIYALNKGIEFAKGEYIARFDSDDLCLSERFRIQYQIASEQKLDFLFSSALLIDACGEPFGGTLSPHLKLWKSCGPIHPAAFFKRQAVIDLGGYANIEFGEDYHLWLRAQAGGFKLGTDSRPVIAYRVHDEQATDLTRLTDTFATNVGVKMMIGLRMHRPLLIVGACVDLLFLIYRKCRNMF